MKKIIITLAAFALLTTGSVMAQTGYNGGYNQYPNANAGGYNQGGQGGYNNQYPAPSGGYNQYPAPNQGNPRFDDAQDWSRIERLDEIVNLSGHQRREIKRIEDHYDQLGLTPNSRLYPQETQRLRGQKQQDIMSVLDPIQRDRLYAFQQGRRSNRGDAYGRRW